ncbi:MAG: hypothetical protein IKN86_07565, partial [Bacteroidaceae bacterium]|nr:hypothetical protein [Bacteroidaceae bacterium]
AARSISPGLPNSCPKTDIDGSLSFLYCCIYLSMESYQRTTAKREKKSARPHKAKGHPLFCGDKGTHFQKNNKTLQQLFSKNNKKKSAYLIIYMRTRTAQATFSSTHACKITENNVTLQRIN